LRRFIVWAGILTASTVANPAQEPPQSEYRKDPRLARLAGFFNDYGPPVRHLAADFLAAADRHNLDWRLLPSISVIESGGGKEATNNNIFGWNSARTGFATVRDGIYLVASRLANSRLYKGKELDEVLTTYNPRPGYAARVRSVMKLIDAVEPLQARSVVREVVNPPSGLQPTARLAPAP
jgi:hypothetical protein